MPYPNTAPLAVGAYVEAVHPHTVGRYPIGVVTGYEPDYPAGPHVSVRTGRGSTVSGPAANWQPTDQRPDWLAS